jgi:hypothetical protein
VAAKPPVPGNRASRPFTEHYMRFSKRPKASKLGLEAHYVSSTRPATGQATALAIANLSHWVIRPANSRTTTRVWRFH